ncbi:MAG: phenylalanine--tRNA ligase subunit beta [Bacteroidota bacterium]
MKISLNWLKDYLSIDLDPDKISEILTDIGLEVEGMETVESIKGGLAGVLVGEVKTCQQHPNADRLSLTTVDVGREQDLQIVCGAPNVAAGQKVMVATIGTTLHFSDGNEVKIKKGKIRGEHSEGMICAEDELGIGDSHEGIIVLPNEVAVGTAASDYFEIETDVVYDIGLTPNRSDATSHTGVAKDLAAALKINYEHAGTVKMPDVSGFKVDQQNYPIEVVVEDALACPRYTGVTITGLTVKESPNWLKNRLKAIGVRPINNIVDATNFILHELGQPLHAFDADQISGRKVIVKQLPEGSKFLSLDKVERTLHSQDLMICDGESKGMCIAGVFGGINSGVTENTKNVFLESAHFNAKSIRRTSTRHLLRTDAAVCFEKGSDPNLTRYALQRAVLLFQELAGGEVASEIIDIYPTTIDPVKVEVQYDRINRLIGVAIAPEKVKEILRAMAMGIVDETATGLTVAVPTNKVDVVREVDVIEEILRIYGFNQVPVPTYIKSAIMLREKPDKQKVRNVVGDLLMSCGFNEMMAVSLTQSNYYKDSMPIPEQQLVYVNNTSNIHLDIMRPNMLLSGLEAIQHNQNRQSADLKLYEFGHSYLQLEEGFKEEAHLSLWLSGHQSGESWLNKDHAVVTYHTLKAYVHQVMARLGFGNYQQTALGQQGENSVMELTYGLRYHRGPQILVEFGKVRSALVKQMGIKQEVFYADFKWDTILRALKKQKIDFEELTKYPSVRRDLALVIDNSINFDDIAVIAKKTGKKLLKDINLFDVYKNEEQLGKDKKSYAVSFIFEDPTKTLKDKEVDKIMNKLIEQYEGKLGAKIRR